ncbi:MAG: urate hydroxylase PuuD [Geminicoccaceae bacterium]
MSGLWPVLGDWLELLVRWVHLLAGILWIGTSFYFIGTDMSLRRRDRLPEGVGGETWQVHGGGFYNIQKYMVAPAHMPRELHWFKWEAYSTWISGAFLMVLIYYAGAELYLIDPAVLSVSKPMAIGLSLVSLALGWLAYDRLCKSALGTDSRILALALFALLSLAAFAYTQVYSGRGAYIHVGAFIGTIMVANVFFVIIPNQKIVVADLLAGQQPDPALGAQAKQRSLHNNYLTLPVLFVMISNHYPMAFSADLNWLILIVVILAGGLVRHFFNEMDAGHGQKWWLWAPVSACLALVIALSLPRPVAGTGEAVAFNDIAPIVAEHCAVCHAEHPSYDGFAEAPAGILLDTPDAIIGAAPLIHEQAVVARAMPLGNTTGMTDDERALLAAWIAAGAPGQAD